MFITLQFENINYNHQHRFIFFIILFENSLLEIQVLYMFLMDGLQNIFFMKQIHFSTIILDLRSSGF